VYGVVIAFQLAQIVVVGIAYGADSSQWGMLTPFQQWFGYIQDANHLILALAALKAFRREWPFWPLIVVVVLQAAFGFISGFMKPILWIAVILLLASVIAGVNLRRFAVPAIIFAILGVLIVPVAEDLRSWTDAGTLDTSNPAEVAAATIQSLVATRATGTNETWQFVLDRTLYRNALVASTPGIIIEKTPSLIPYQGIEQFLAVPAYVIPRALWRDKPILSRGVWFSIVYLNQPDFTTSSAAITVFGEGYMFAGWIGTMLACLILGLLLAGIYRITAGVGLWAVYIALVPTFIDVEGQFTGMFVALIQRTVVFLLVYALIVRLSNPRQATVQGGAPGARIATGITSGSTERRSP
jgi:hypothetical protein